ncbi:hypothetical protein SteCoe_27237 [Stentor coeruleus]|uniref:Uncharacterized protein n=1 Tax=Stentor coeruleus TaxID=5963 RepID=A0A1R2BBH6_9CILI|nr:hypothetical protein SteCoe_27237 [Stentor coeruleus]
MKLRIFVWCVLGFLTATQSQTLEDTLELIYSLKEKNIQKQVNDDNEYYEILAQCTENLNDFNEYKVSAEESYEYALKSFNDAKEKFEAVEKDIESLSQEIEFAQEIIGTLGGLRCDETTIFIQNLKDSKEALDLIRYIQIDTEKFYSKKISEFASINSKLTKLLGGLADVPEETSTEEYLKTLKSLVQQNVENLEKKELKSAKDYAYWHALTIKANDRNVEDLHERDKIVQGLKIQLEKVQGDMERAQNAVNHAKMLVKAEEERCEKESIKYTEAKAINDGDLKLIEETIKIFKKQVRQTKELSNTLGKE